MIQQAQTLFNLCQKNNIRLSFAESCTGGLLCSAITEISGASSVFDRGFIVYSNQAKTELLGVAPEIIEAHGAVSEEVAKAMAIGTIQNSVKASQKKPEKDSSNNTNNNISNNIGQNFIPHAAISITGIAGPDGGSAEKPVGLVCFGFAFNDTHITTKCVVFDNKGRGYIREQAALFSMDFLAKYIKKLL